MSREPGQRYRFGPRERGGGIAGWRAGQIVTVAIGLLLGVLALRWQPDAAGVVAAIGILVLFGALATVPVASRTGDEWLPVTVCWAVRRVGWPGRRPLGTFRGLRLLQTGWHGMGVIHDSRARTLTAALAVRGRSFALLGADEQDRRVGAWSSVLASLAREGSPVHRVQWVAATFPDDGRGVRDYVSSAADPGASSACSASYESLLEDMDSHACAHDLVLAVQVRVTKSIEVGCAALARELGSLVRQLGDAEVQVDAVLGSDALACCMLRSYEPVAASAGSDWSEGDPWPMAMEERWSSVRVDGMVHATFWVAEWPRVEVRSDFLAPVLLGATRATLAVVMAPLGSDVALRKVEASRTADLADAELRRRGGFVSTARQARESEVLARREAELAEGHASYRYSGYLTVSAPSAEELESVVDAVQHAAGQSRLALRRLYGDQASAYTCTLPFCRGGCGEERTYDGRVADPATPRNLVVLLLDSLNRHMLGSYGGTEFDTPNLDAFAARSVRFTSHVTGSLPCMPARHDILCGSLDFLWRPWGSIEIWEEPITAQLRRAGVTTMLVSDHPHLFETGGENYHTDFTAWDYVRGHEGDPWRTFADPSHVGAPALPARGGAWYWQRLGMTGALDRPYDQSRTFFRAEEDFPGPRTMRTAADWLRRGAPSTEPFLLFVDEFDPHEPFDTPEPWAGRYDPGWEGDLVIWPPYDVGAVAAGRLSEREGRQIRANYGAKLSMIDHWVGRVFDALTDRNLWESTAVVVCTDHGHYLGEKDIWGKPGVMQFEPLGHTPLLVHWPGISPGVCAALTTNVDLHATVADVFGVAPRGVAHGASLVPLLRGEVDRVREWALGGVYGNWVQVTDGRHKYARGPDGENFPLSMWSNRWSTMPVHGLEDEVRLPPPDGRARLDFMPASQIPVIRQPYEPGDRLPFWVGQNTVDAHFLFDLQNDPLEEENLVGHRVETDMVEMLRVALRAVEAPDEQFERLGVA